MKTLDELVEFLNANVKQWQEEVESYPEAKAKREGAIECCGLIGNFLDGAFDAPVSETDAEESQAETTP